MAHNLVLRIDARSIIYSQSSEGLCTLGWSVEVMRLLTYKAEWFLPSGKLEVVTGNNKNAHLLLLRSYLKINNYSLIYNHHLPLFVAVSFNGILLI